MIEINITEQQKTSAKQRFPFKELNGSIMQGKSNIYGALGEIVVLDYFKELYDIEDKSTYDYDLIIGGYKVDVKTKRTTVTPKPYYLCSITWNIKQKCKYYFFVRIKEDLSKAFLLGYISKEMFFEQADFKKKGDLDVNGFVFKADCYNLQIKNLNKFKIKE